MRILLALLLTVLPLSAQTLRDGIAATVIDGITAASVDGVTVSGAGGTTLTNDLISYWAFDEAADSTTGATRVDAHSSNDLTDTTATASATGKISNGVDFEASDSEFFTIAEPHDFEFSGNQNFSISIWWKPETVTDQTLISVFTTIGNNRSYQLRIENDDDTVRFKVSSGGDSGTEVEVTGAVLTAGTWYHIVAYHDGDNDLLGVIVDDGTPATAAHSLGIFDSAAIFNIGQRPSTERADGVMDELAIYSRVITSAEITELYNSGSGLAYPF